MSQENRKTVDEILDKGIAKITSQTDGNSTKFQKFNAPVILDVGFCFYETSVKTVKRAIESVREHVRYIFAIDGKFEDFESDDQLSSPEVRDYLRSVPNVILFDHPNRKEYEKRQQYLHFAQKYMSDYLLILDADEFMTDECDWQTAFNEMARLYTYEKLPKIFGVIMRHGKKEASYPRIWRMPYMISYMKTHNFWKFKTDGTVWKSQITFPPMKGLFMKGNDKDRDEDYVKRAYAYQQKLMKYEKPYKEEYRRIARNIPNKLIDTRLSGIPVS